MRGLFTSEWRGDTIGLWAAFFSGLLAVYLAFSWIPSLLTSAGFSASIASTGVPHRQDSMTFRPSASRSGYPVTR